MKTLDLKRKELKIATRGGFVFPISYGLTMAVVAAFAFVLPTEQASLALLFQGMIALPMAFGIMKMTGTAPPQDHPLNDLSAFLAGSQAMALPAYIFIYAMDPLYLPIVFASVGAMHFVPYVWLQSSKAWIFLSIGMAFIPYGLVVWLGVTASYPLIPLSLSVMLLVTGIYVYKNSEIKPLG